MQKYSFEEVKDRIAKLISLGSIPEVSLFMYDNEYMIIVFRDSTVSFQRCGNYDEGSGELYYDTLDELYNSVTVDGILLKRNWDDITEIYSDNHMWDYTEEEYQAALVNWKEVSKKYNY